MASYPGSLPIESLGTRLGLGITTLYVHRGNHEDWCSKHSQLEPLGLILTKCQLLHYPFIHLITLSHYYYKNEKKNRPGYEASGCPDGGISVHNLNTGNSSRRCWVQFPAALFLHLNFLSLHHKPHLHALTQVSLIWIGIWVKGLV